MKNPISLYIHWPFCISKCPYCDFNSHVRDQVVMADWQAALLADMAHEAQLTKGRAISSIFFGGGTPSLMPPKLVEAMLNKAQILWGFTPDIEISLEANPNSVEAANFADLAAAGVNRLSLGVQSFDPAALTFLGRAHSEEEAAAALQLAAQHFARFSFDLIYALPNQSLSDWRNMLARALDYGSEHLSLYQLTIEEGTRFATDVRRGGFTPLDDEAAADMFEMTQEVTEVAGIPAYETSNHARAGAQSRHNLTYWRYQDYVGIGPGAHGRRNAMATERHKKPENFLSATLRNGHGLREERLLPPREQAAEALMMGLRLAEGIDPAAMAARFGLSEGDIIQQNAAERLIAQGLLNSSDDRLIISKQGRLLLNAIIAELMPD